MSKRNDITGDSLTTKPSTDSYRDNWEKIFGKKTQVPESDNDVEKSPDRACSDEENDND